MQKSSEITRAGQNAMFGPNEIVVGMSGSLKVSCVWNWCTTPSSTDSGLGSGGRKRSPSRRRTV